MTSAGEHPDTATGPDTNTGTSTEAEKREQQNTETQPVDTTAATPESTGETGQPAAPEPQSSDGSTPPQSTPEDGVASSDSLPDAAQAPDTGAGDAKADEPETRPFPDEKKRSLIEGMRELKDSDMHLATRARRIRALQEDWHSHGTPTEDDPLWQEFNELGRLAFEPCKTYFHERKKLMKHNLAERRQICEQLEAWVTSQDGDKNADVGEINRLEKQAREQWKQFAPVPQKQVANIQGRFNEVLKSLRNIRRKTLVAHAARKKELVAQAAELVEADDLQPALQEAKRLQKEWKQVGPAPHKDERQLWEEFRKHCDALFARRPAPSGKGGGKNAAKGQNRSGKADNRQRQNRPTGPRIDRKHQTVLETLSPVAQLCRDAEESVLAGQQPDTDELKARWEELTLPDNNTTRQPLEERFQQLVEEKPAVADLEKQARDNAEQARALCVELEIQAGLDSPPEDKSMRMQRQLELLKEGLGQGLSDAKTRAHKLGESLITLSCMGPLAPSDRQAFEKRLNRIR